MKEVLFVFGDLCAGGRVSRATSQVYQASILLYVYDVGSDKYDIFVRIIVPAEISTIFPLTDIPLRCGR